MFFGNFGFHHFTNFGPSSCCSGLYSRSRSHHRVVPASVNSSCHPGSSSDFVMLFRRILGSSSCWVRPKIVPIIAKAKTESHYFFPIVRIVFVFGNFGFHHFTNFGPVIGCPGLYSRSWTHHWVVLASIVTSRSSSGGYGHFIMLFRQMLGSSSCSGSTQSCFNNCKSQNRNPKLGSIIFPIVRTVFDFMFFGNFGFHHFANFGPIIMLSRVVLASMNIPGSSPGSNIMFEKSHFDQLRVKTKIGRAITNSKSTRPKNYPGPKLGFAKNNEVPSLTNHRVVPASVNPTLGSTKKK